MNVGNQRELADVLGCNRSRIAQIKKAKPYLFDFIGKKINIDTTALKILEAGYFASPDKKNNGSKGKDKPKTAPTHAQQAEDLTKSGPLQQEDTRARLERHKIFHQAEKERINNEEKLKNLVSREDIGETAFELFRPIRDDLQAMASKLGARLTGLSQHEIERHITDEIHRILESVTSKYEGDDDDVKKNLTAVLLDRAFRR